MDKYLKCLVDILKNNPGGIIIVCADTLPLQREASAIGVLIASKRIPYKYATSRGHLWDHNNSKTHLLTIK